MQRHKLLALVIRQLTTSMISGDKHHLLLIGPPGSGKTHLVSLAVWELKQNPHLSDMMRIAWPGEGHVFSELIHFALAIARTLAISYPNEFPMDFRSDVRGLPRDDAALAILHTILSRLEHRHLLLVIENLDQTFDSLGESGQKKLRAFLQETRRIAILSTSQKLFPAVASRDEAFFGFFDTHHLQPLNVDDALQLMRHIAAERLDSDLMQFLCTTQARNRIRALHHLIGGNSRPYVLMATFLTRDALDELVPAFEMLFELITPSLQERLITLPDQQRQLVQCLCEASGSLTVREISEETFIAEGNCSSQLGNLRSNGFVCSEKRGRESYYELADPCMRLCLQDKNPHGRPLKRMARFLKTWFSDDQPQPWIPAPPAETLTDSNCTSKISGAELSSQNTDTRLLPASQSSFQAGHLNQPLAVAENPLQPVNTCLQTHESTKKLIDDVADATTSIPSDQQAQEHVKRGIQYWKSGNWQASLTELNAALSPSCHDADLRTYTLFALPLAMIAIRSRDDVALALMNAFNQGHRLSQAYGGQSFELLSMLLRRGPSEWASDVARIAPLYVHFGVADKLGQSLVRSIQLLDTADFSASQLELWSQAWQQIAADCEDLQVPVSCLTAAIEVLKLATPGDRPLFQLTLDLRRIVRPLLQRSLAAFRSPEAASDNIPVSDV